MIMRKIVVFKVVLIFVLFFFLIFEIIEINEKNFFLYNIFRVVDIIKYKLK